MYGNFDQSPMDISQRIESIDKRLKRANARSYIPRITEDKAVTLLDTKKAIQERELTHLQDTFHREWVKDTPPLCELVRLAMEFVEQMITDYSKILEVPTSGALKKKIVMDLTCGDSDKRTDIIALIDMIADLANGNHGLHHKTNTIIAPKKGGTVRALKKRLGI